MKRVYGIFGWPVWHTRSPVMQNAALAALNMDAAYVPFSVPPSRLADAVNGLTAMGIRGVNITLPHKRAIIPLLDEVDRDATAIGAVNTVVQKGKRLLGTNTDAQGLVRALREEGFKPRGTKIIVVGSGGAARAAVAGLGKAGASQIVIAARNPKRADELIADLTKAVGKTKLTTIALADKKTAPYKDADLLVQATSATLDDGPRASRFAATLPLGALPKHAIVTDVVYTPRVTTVLRAAAKQELKTVDGIGMLLHQGAIAFELWTGRDAPLDVMRAALE